MTSYRSGQLDTHLIGGTGEPRVLIRKALFYLSLEVGQLSADPGAIAGLFHNESSQMPLAYLSNEELAETTIMVTTAQMVTNISTDQSVLLSLKSHITNLEPSHILSKNWSDSASVCDWIGVTCGSRHQRVTALDISMMGLRGTLRPELGNLSFLVSLNLSRNLFHGNLPQDFARLRRLRFIDLSFNTLSGDVPSWFGFLHGLQLLYLRNNSFTGFIPQELSNMSKLEALDLSYNSIQGNIPQEIGNLFNLKMFTLRYNRLAGSVPLALYNISSIERFDLTGNSFHGNIPDSICHGTFPSLEGLYLAANDFDGEIPANLSKCSKLRILSLSYNRFSGSMPREFGNLRQLQILYLGDNNFTGEIPEELGNITTLREIDLPGNNFTGSIPASIFNISSLQYINIAQSSLTGTLPANMCSNLNQLAEIYLHDNNVGGHIPTRLHECSALRALGLSGNNFIGTIPREIGNATLLQLLHLTNNKLTGVIPKEIGNLYNLEEFLLDGNNISGSIPTSLLNISTLRILSVAENRLTGYVPPDLGYGLPNIEVIQFFGNNLSASQDMSFITSLMYCRNLRGLNIGGNPLNGVLPPSIGNLSALQSLYAYNCGLKGSIPDEIGNLTNLMALSLWGNHLTGPFPKTLANLGNLQGLFLSLNKINATIPSSICALQNLNTLVLNVNEIYGEIPACIGNITALRTLYLDSNKLDSTIPLSLWHITDILQLNLSSNSLVGSLSPDIGNLRAVDFIDLSMNKLSGTIPSSIGDLQVLRSLSLAYNTLEGPIPELIAEMVNLEIIDLSHNTLSGSIPGSFEKLSHLKDFNVSYNNLNGEIPSGGPFKNFTRESFMFNIGLCGDARYQVPPCRKTTSARPKRKTKKLRVIFICVGASVLVLVMILAYGVTRFGRRKSVPRILNLEPDIAPSRVSYYELVEATNGYNESNLLGSGSFGSVYKGTLRNGKVVAVKVFHSQSEDAFKSFERECQVLKNLRHRNLCKVVASCSNQDFKALILDYMPNGSLEKWLYSDDIFLDIIQRISIMIDVASALQYLHHGQTTPVVHCDLKPSNVLLDENMVARLCDFGVAKLLGDAGNSTQTMTLATFGYIAPEFGLDGRVSMRCDVYSYGIMLMEVFTRVKPNDESFVKDLSLRRWVQDSMSDIVQIIDANLLRTEDEWSSTKMDCLHSIMELALNCSLESPHERISIKDVTASLKKIKDRLIAY
ncbi:hypothetical protein DH2020_014557 [Rehmannia glutinosa]|uniref:non-specific serine/threonine protein kinase n=1 Tax=Rehmannia glutinosa TaxID=99300 RepID=A0ABR0WWR8_REHGL